MNALFRQHTYSFFLIGVFTTILFSVTDVHAVETSVAEDTLLEYTPGRFAKAIEKFDDDTDTELVIRIFDEQGNRIRGFYAWRDSDLNRSPRLVRRDGGGFAVVWLNVDDDNFRRNSVYLRTFDENVQRVASTVRIAGGGTTVRRSDPDIATLSNGDYVITYENENDLIGYQVVGIEGNRIGALRAGARGIDRSFRSRVVPLAVGGFQIIYLKDGQILATEYDNEGTRVRDEFPADTSILDTPIPTPTPTPQPTPTPAPAPEPIEILGTNSNDFIQDNSKDNIIRTFGGSDIIYARNGTNEVLAGSGNDRILAGAGNDTLSGGSGNDNIYAGDGNDLITGDNGNDLLRGELGNDTIYGGRGDDNIAGSGGDDIIFGGSGDDIISGGWGSDILVSGSNEGNRSARFFGNSEPDIFVLSKDFGHVVISDFEPGIDLVAFEDAAPTSFDFREGANDTVYLDVFGSTVEFLDLGIQDISVDDFIPGGYFRAR